VAIGERWLATGSNMEDGPCATSDAGHPPPACCSTISPSLRNRLLPPMRVRGMVPHLPSPPAAPGPRAPSGRCHRREVHSGRASVEPIAGRPLACRDAKSGTKMKVLIDVRIKARAGSVYGS
jgi:hypothetical protein